MQINLSALEAFLNLPIWLIATIITIPIAIVISLGILISARRNEDPELADFGKEALAIVSGAFIFVGAFAVVTSWDNQTRFATSITNEFTSATSLAEDFGGIGDPRGKLVAEALVEYALTVKSNEIGASGMVGPYQLPSSLYLLAGQQTIERMHPPADAAPLSWRLQPWRAC